MSLSSNGSTRSTSPSTSSSQPIRIGFTPSGTDALLDIFHSASTQSSQYSTCAYPSWPSGSALKDTTFRRPSAYVSDEDLYGDDDAPYLSEPPPQPRPAQVWAMAVAQPLLPPVTKTRRRGSGGKREKKHRASSVSSTG